MHVYTLSLVQQQNDLGIIHHQFLLNSYIKIVLDVNQILLKE